MLHCLTTCVGRCRRRPRSISSPRNVRKFGLRAIIVGNGLLAYQGGRFAPEGAGHDCPSSFGDHACGEQNNYSKSSENLAEQDFTRFFAEGDEMANESTNRRRTVALAVVLSRKSICAGGRNRCDCPACRSRSMFLEHLRPPRKVPSANNPQVASCRQMNGQFRDFSACWSHNRYRQ